MNEYTVALKLIVHLTQKNRNCTIKNFLFQFFEREHSFFLNVFTENQVKLG
jgi:hypothetical protein